MKLTAFALLLTAGKRRVYIQYFDPINGARFMIQSLNIIPLLYTGCIGAVFTDIKEKPFFCQYFSDGTSKCYLEYISSDQKSTVKTQTRDASFSIIGLGSPVPGTTLTVSSDFMWPAERRWTVCLFDLNRYIYVVIFRKKDGTGYLGTCTFDPSDHSASCVAKSPPCPAPAKGRPVVCTGSGLMHIPKYIGFAGGMKTQTPKINKTM